MMMELAPWASFLAVVLATALVLVVTALYRRNRKSYKLPPGPRAWPVIGNLNLMGPLPHHSLYTLSSRYGPLMSLRFGLVPVVVGSSVDAARSILKTNDLAFIDRPRTAAGKYTAYNNSSMLWSPYDDYWRQARKLWQTELLSTKQLKLYEHARGEEVSAMLRDLHAESSSSSGAAVALSDHLMMASLNVISRMVLGKKYVVKGSSGSSEDTTTAEEFGWMMEELFFLNGAVNIGDVIPWLNWLDPQGYIGRMKRLSKVLDRFLEKVLDEHDERRRRDGEAFVAMDMVDKLLQLADDPNLKVPITRDGVKAFTLWAMTELLKKPEVLTKATEELDRVVGRNRLVAEGDIPNLPYLEAIVKETMRTHPVAPLLTPRQSREDTSVGGYDIPAGTRVLINVMAICLDPSVWDKPMEFRPERFLGSSVDVRGQDLELLPFGSGRRMCPGHTLGLKMVHVTLANLLHGFHWRLPDGVAAEELSMEENFRMNVLRKVPLEAAAEPKLPAHLYVGP
ncbi:hypothetical protein HU200_005482 [Digitaria exilis]|uniref:Cytochrome P450 n=1 Tax=Digitaria exilis TaxID=1010633 RepID=A0A835FTY6_9POAL|nr:hypothetical protein HU200_005482 [Digitaria exilis]